MHDDRQVLAAWAAAGQARVANNIRFEGELVDVWPDMRAALNVVVTCRGRQALGFERGWESVKAAPNVVAVVEALLRRADCADLTGERGLLIAQLRHVFIMRECRNGVLIEHALQRTIALATAGCGVVIHSAYPAPFVETVLARFGILPCVTAIAGDGADLPCAPTPQTPTNPTRAGQLFYDHEQECSSLEAA
ncbi:MAG: hypothetical protein H7X91_01555 [Burkholderiales bacterium]|nr:hypothetical protein [Burkholderiales bacterium]